MAHEHLESMTEKSKRKNKIRGFNAKILDDGTYMLEMQNEDYEKNKTYSYRSFDEMMRELKKDFPRQTKQKEDNLTKKE